jgi:tetratricopeptide (TPR) repeat protein
MRRGLSHALYVLGEIELRAGDLDAAERHYIESLEGFRVEGPPFSVAAMLLNLGLARTLKGTFEEAAEALEEAIALAECHGYTHVVAGANKMLGELFAAQGEYERARECLSQAMAVRRHQPASVDTAQLLESFALLAAFQGRHAKAVRLDAAGSAIKDEPRAAKRELASPPWVDERIDASRAALGPAEAAMAEEQGRAMTLDEAIEYAMARG